MQAQNQVEIVNELVRLIETLQKNKLLPTGLDKTKLVQNVMETLNKAGVDLKLNEVVNTPQNVEMRTKLGLAFIEQNKNKQTYVQLFTDSLKLEDVLGKKLNNIFENMLKMKGPRPDQKKLIEDNLKQIENMLLHLRYKDNDEKLAKTFIAMDILDKHLEEQLRDQRIKDYGVDTHNPGAVLFVLRSVVSGNETERQDLSTHGENFMAQIDDPTLGGEDYLGMKTSAVINSLMDGVIASPSEEKMLEQIEGALGKMKNDPDFKQYQSPTNTPLGPLGS